MYTIYMVPNEMAVSEVARNLNVDFELLKKINGIESDLNLQTGTYVVVPKNYSDDFVTYKVRPGDTIISIARQNDIDYMQLLDLNGLDKDQYIYVDQEIMIPNKGVKFLITKDEETLKDVAKKFQVDEQTLLEQNKTIYLRPEQLLIYKKRD